MVDNPYLGGYASGANTRSALVNGELVSGIDSRTVNGANNSIIEMYGTSNAAMTKEEADLSDGTTWHEVKEDSRDLLGGIVTIKSTFAKFLDYWPEFSLITSSVQNNNTNTHMGIITVNNSYVYRVGDNVVSNTNPNVEANVVSISDRTIEVSLSTRERANTFFSNTNIDNRLYIVNPQADTESYVEEVFKINQLESLTEDVATFNLTSWLQYFRHIIPKRKYYTNTCGFKYRDNRCGYPGPKGSSTSNRYRIPGTTNLYSNTYPITVTNQQGSTNAEDVCNKTLEACRLRNNSHRFGGFISVRR